MWEKAVCFFLLPGDTSSIDARAEKKGVEISVYDVEKSKTTPRMIKDI